VIVTAVEVATTEVVTVNVAVVAPAATVTFAGVVEDALLSDKVTTAPPAGAGLFNVTVPVEGLPPNTVAGFMATAAIPLGFRVNAAV
jgi:hypothetical protein